MKYLITFLVTFAPSLLLAQFNGGRGDGSDQKQTIQTNLNGFIGGVRVLYQGGDGDGFHQGSAASFLNGTSAAILFTGGDGDGHSNNSYNSFLQGTSSGALYSGGEGDGFAVSSEQLFINGTSSISLFSGGNGDGFSNLTHNAFVNGVTTSVIFSGGVGDGFSVKGYDGFVNGVSAGILYSGGEGDGFSNLSIQSFVNGVSASVLFSGGDGDGFATANYTGTLVVVPLSLISFDATSKSDYVLVQWVTENEEGTKFFTVERSRDGSIFNGLMNVPAAGNTASQQKYNWNDNTPLPGRSYYRLLWTDKDGQKGYSDIRSVIFDKNNSSDFILFPNPNNGRLLNLQIDGFTAQEKVTISISDAAGKNIIQFSDPVRNGNKLTIHLPSALASGTYTVSVIRQGNVHSKILIVR